MRAASDRLKTSQVAADDPKDMAFDLGTLVGDLAYTYTTSSSSGSSTTTPQDGHHQRASSPVPQTA